MKKALITDNSFICFIGARNVVVVTNINGSESRQVRDQSKKKIDAILWLF